MLINGGRMALIIVLAVTTIVILLLYLLSRLFSPQKLDIDGGHVLVTGGSSGIGKCIAVEAALRGANVTLLARNQAKLTETKTCVEQQLKDSSKQSVLCISVDLADNYNDVEKAVKEAEGKLGPVTVLVNCAGWSMSGRFEDISVEHFKKMMNINYFGSVFATRAVVPGMKARGVGRIIFLSSQAGQLGLFGYSAYAASKFALRGLAESLQMEVKPYNIRVTLSFPPDTDTPGFEEENKHKPKETHMIAETAGLFKPEDVAKHILDDGLAGRFLSYVGLEGWMLAQMTAGMTPVTTIWDLLAQFFIMGILRVVGVFYLFHFDSIVKKCKVDRGEPKKEL